MTLTQDIFYSVGFFPTNGAATPGNFPGAIETFIPKAPSRHPSSGFFSGRISE